MPDKCNATTNVYQLSDGSYQAQIYAAPIRFKDTSGNWQAFDTSLIPTGLAGQWQTTQTPVQTTLGQSAQLVWKGHTVTLGLPNLGFAAVLAPSGDQVGLSGVATATNVSYRALNWGVEQSLSLTSPGAPTTFTATLSHPGLTLAQDASGQWGLYAAGGPRAIFVLSGINVTDSSSDALGQPASCAGASMTVTPGKNTSTLTYSLPAGWLADPARVFPVTVDPTLTVNPSSGGTATYIDTYVSSLGTDNHPSATSLGCGKTSGTPGYYCRDLVGFDISALPDGAYIDSATLALYKNSGSGTNNGTAYLRPMWEAWSGASSCNWNSLGFVAHTFPVSYVDYGSVAAGNWLDLDATGIVQSWLSGAQQNYGFELNQQENGTQGSSYYSSYNSADNTSNPPNIPVLTVNYDPAPSPDATTDASVYTWGDTAAITVKADTFYTADVNWIETGLNLTSSDHSTWRGVVGWFKSESLVPSSNWTKTQLGSGSWVAYYQDPNNPTDYGAGKITLNPGDCSSGGVSGTTTDPGYHFATFNITIGDNFGSLVSVSPDVRFGMGPSDAATTWGSGGTSAECLSGDLSHPQSATGWTNQAGAAFSVIQTKLQTLTYAAQGSDWFNAASGNDDVAGQGRGAATLMWPKVASADGYHVYANDGSGSYRLIGATLGSGSISWSSSGTAFYPRDSEIQALTAPYAGNPFYRAATPADGYGTTTSTVQATLTPTPAPSPTGSPGDGVCVSDGSYVYTHGLYGDGGPTTWVKVGTGYGGTTAGQNCGTVGGDLSTVGGSAYTGLLLNGILFNGRTTSVTASQATLAGVRIADGSSQSLTLTRYAPVNSSKGSTCYGNTPNLLFSSGTDSGGTTHIYSVAYTLSSNGDGSPRYDGYKIRDYSYNQTTQTGSYLADHTIGLPNGLSDSLDGVMCDGNFLYLVAWTGTNGAHITKVSTQTWQIVNQWGINQSTTGVAGGCYDATNNCFWAGSATANHIYRYSGSGGLGAATCGFDLRDNPNALYTKTANGAAGAMPSSTYYDFKVVPFTYTSGEFAPANASAYEVAATLDNRTYTNNDDPAHTVADLGNWDGHDVSARLDAGALQVTTTDLAIASWGPPAEVSRTYLPSNAQNRFAPGWVFNFDAHLDLSQAGNGAVDYYDQNGDKHHFVKPGSTWQSPRGFLGTLATGGGVWVIGYPDGTTDYYSASGVLTSETDRNSNATTYAWNAGNLTITAANGQSILVHCSSSPMTATYATSAGTREVDYQTSPWRVTYYPNQSVQKVVRYDYDGSSRLSGIDQLDWPTSGNNVGESFVYGTGGLVEVDYPDYNATTKPDARLTIAYGNAGAYSATVTHHGRVNDTANQPTKVETDSWSAASGAQESRLESATASAETQTTLYSYAANGQLGGALSLATSTANNTHEQISACYANGNPATESGGTGAATTTLIYGDQNNPNLPTQEIDSTDSVHRVTTNTYDTHGNLTEQAQNLNTAGDQADTQNTYQDVSVGGHTFHAALNEQKQLISGTASNGTWAVTDYSNFAANGQPQTTINRGVVRTYGGQAQDLTSYATYDDFGNLLTKTDSSGTRVTETDTYDLAGECLTSTDAMGIITNSTYDALGYVTASWQSNAGSLLKVSWKQDTDDPMGRVLSETTLLTHVVKPKHGSSYLASDTQDVTTNTWDGVGNEITSDSSTLGGEPAKWIYDDSGQCTESWAEGVVDYSDARAVRSAYDASGNVLTETDPGDADATISSYNPDGSLAKQTNPDSSWTTYGYDLDGNKVSETNPKSGYGHGSDPSKVATTSYTYDWANRLASETKPNGMSTVCGYDELGSQVSATGNGGPATTTTYNTLGWVLRTVDANGITDSKSYDTAGRVTSETKGSQNATTSSYNDDNQLTSQTDPDGRLVTNSYDLFGNLKEEQHTVGGTVVKDITTSHDSLNRPTLSLENVSGEGHSWTYPLNTAAGVTEVVTPAGGGPTQTTISRDARNQETQRSTAISGNPTALVRTVDSRDAVDRVTQATLGGSNVQHWSYDSGCGRQVRQWGSGWASGAANADAYTYDQDTGQKSGDNLQLSLGGTVGGSYTYDGNRRLATASVNGVSENYTFDAAGNLTQIVAGATTSTLHYNAADRLTELDKTGGVNSTTIYLGNATYGWRTSQGPTQQNQPITYTYTATGRLAGYGDTTRNLTATYAYDASGQRQQSTVTVGSTTTTTTYVYDGLTLNELSASRSDGANWLIDYVYDENGVPYAGVYDGSSYSGLVFGMITSDRGDVVELVDANGNAFACYHYDAWGNPVGGASDQWGKPTGITVTTTSLITTQQLALDIATRQVLRYAGYVYDPESYLYYCSARSYDPATRQFISPDLAKADGEESAYQYCGGNPVAIVDPTGTKGERFAPKYFYDNTAYFKLVLRRDAGHARLALGYWGTFCWESPGHEWDYKIFYGRTSAQKYTDCWFFLGHWISPDDFGNIHFGYICAEMWYPKWMITWFSRRANTGMPASKEKKDEEFIKWGYQLHHLWGSDMSLKWWHVQYYYR